MRESARPDSDHGAAARNQVDDQDDDGGDQQDPKEITDLVDTHQSQQPGDQQDRKNGPKHKAVTGYTSINAIIKAEMFPADIRALGVALPYAIANALFGGTAEYVALYLKDVGHERWFYVYISLLSFCSLIAYVRMRETKTSSRILED